METISRIATLIGNVFVPIFAYTFASLAVVVILFILFSVAFIVIKRLFFKVGFSTISEDNHYIQWLSKECNALTRQLCYIKAYYRYRRINEVLTEDGRFIDPEGKIQEIPLPDCTSYTVKKGKAKFGELWKGDELTPPSLRKT